MQPSFHLFAFTRSRGRALACVVAGMLFASQVLAATGLCAGRSATVAPATEAAIAETCEDADHLASLERAAGTANESATPAGGAGAPHCSSGDPSAQGRSADLPGGTAQAAAAPPSLPAVAAVPPSARLPIADAGPPLRPLYARLNRLLL